MLFPSIETREVQHKIAGTNAWQNPNDDNYNDEKRAFQTISYRDGMRLIFLLYPLTEALNYQGYSYYVSKLD